MGFKNQSSKSCQKICLTHCSQETHKRVTDTLCRPRSDAAESGI